MILPSPCFTDEFVWFISWADHFFLHTLAFPSVWCSLFLVSSAHTPLFQLSDSYCWWKLCILGIASTFLPIPASLKPVLWRSFLFFSSQHIFLVLILYLWIWWKPSRCQAAERLQHSRVSLPATALLLLTSVTKPNRSLNLTAKSILSATAISDNSHTKKNILST